MAPRNIQSSNEAERTWYEGCVSNDPLSDDFTIQSDRYILEDVELTIPVPVFCLLES